MALDGLRQALELSVAANAAAVAGDVERVQALLDERTPYLVGIALGEDDLESGRAILTQIQRLDRGTAEALADLREALELERGQLRRAGRARDAYRPSEMAFHLDRDA